MGSALNTKATMSSRGAGRKLAIIGAGPAGLTTARTLLVHGFEVVVYEKGSKVGGTWVWDNDNGRNYLYRNLHINTSKRLTQFEDFPFDADTQPVPDHHDMARYLDRYAEHFGLKEHILFRTEVVHVTPWADGGWAVHSADGAVRRYDAVVVAAGAFSRPAHPEALRDAFTGRYLHSAEYRAPESFVGQRVCIIGAGNSAVDIASDICTTAARTVLVARSPVFVMPHTVFGRPIGDLARHLQHRWVPAGVRRRVLAALVKAVHGDMAQHGFKPLTHRVHATISSTIVQDILFRRVAVRQGIARIDGSTIHFEDGSAETFDALIASTGYVTEFPFLDRPAGQGWLELYKRIADPDHPGLYFVGMINLDTPINYACERQARWIAAVESERLALPSREEMRADIAAKRAWVERTFGRSPRHALQEDSVRYYAELSSSLRTSRRRKAREGGLARPDPRPSRPHALPPSADHRPH